MTDFKINQKISLEPRLQEFIKIIVFNKKNNIEISPYIEKQYSITQEDKNKIIAFQNGQTDLYDQDKQNKYIQKPDLVKPSFPEHDFKNDERFERFKLKMKREKETMKQRHNFDQYENNFDYQSGNNVKVDYNQNFNQNYQNNNQNNYGQNYNQNYNQSNQIYNSQNFTNQNYINQNQSNKNNNFFLEDTYSPFNQYSINYTPKSVLKYNNEPKLQYKQVLHYQQDGKSSIDNPDENNLDNIIGKLDTYTDQSNTMYTTNSSLDFENKINIPSNNTCKNYLNTSRYVPVPLKWKKGGPVKQEDNIQCSLPNRSAKSLGMKNPSDHYFDYISDDIQNPDHVVLPFARGGISSRLSNQQCAKEYRKREI